MAYLPSLTLGILGGGQLGRMIALAAARLGIRAHVFTEHDDDPAVQVANMHTIASFEDVAALKLFAASVDAITLEWENVPVSTLEALAERVPVHPSPHVVQMAQNRISEKNFARSNGIGTTAFIAINSLDDLQRALTVFNLPCILKTCQFGYDGKGQVTIYDINQANNAWQQLGGSPCILEQFVNFTKEVSVIVARNAAGTVATYPVAENKHVNHILSATHAPADLPSAVAAEAELLARNLANACGLIGILGIEMFVLRQADANGRRVLLNEIAPRPHNSGHWTIDACSCSQFEQLVRAVFNFPFGDTKPHSRAIMYNILGEHMQQVPHWLATPGACLHLYGKNEARQGRKMGHVTILGEPYDQEYKGI